jgi:hypothetical protein
MTCLSRIAAGLVLAALASSVAVAQDQAPQQSPAEWQKKHQMGLAHKTAGDLYESLKKAAGGGRVSPPFAQLPDWSGLWATGGGGSLFGRAPGGAMPKVTPPVAEVLKRGAELTAKGIAYDENLSECGPPGYPRWLAIPFLREFIVRPEQTWLSSETVNNVRRIYTDGRGHPSPADAYPLYYGDSIGFWDGQKLVIHTNQLMARSMGRNQPEQSEQMETVEIWEKVGSGLIIADVWLYDPMLYTEPWYMQRRFTQVANPDKALRMNYWHCGENPNNDVYRTPDGNTQYTGFTFTGGDDRAREQSK